MVDWSELLLELCLLVATKLPSVVDVARFGVVCRNWEAAIAHKKRSLLSPKSPCLMLVGYNEASFELFPRNKFLPCHLPRIQGRACFGTPFEWLITVSLDCRVHLLNTISGIRHQLPQVPEHDSSFLASSSVHKAATSLTSPSSTLPEDCKVMVIFSIDKQLGFSNLSDRTWKTLENPRGEYEDILYFEGQFYAVNYLGEIENCDTNSHHLVAKEFAPPPFFLTPRRFDRLFLVEMSGQLHMIVRIQTINEVYHFGVGSPDFDVYRLDFHTKKWTELVSINGHALFIGGNSCFSVLASDYPDCKGNSIYFTYDYHFSNKSCKGYDVGVFDVTFSEVSLMRGCQPGRKIYTCSPPLWIIPKIG